jgi:hypothetical protein
MAEERLVAGAELFTLLEYIVYEKPGRRVGYSLKAGHPV